MLEKLWDENENKITLQIQYRMDSLIRDFPNQMFYKGILQDS